MTTGPSVVFTATDLARPDGVWTPHIPADLRHFWQARHMLVPARHWRLNVVHPVLRHLLLPALPVPVEVRYGRDGTCYAVKVGQHWFHDMTPEHPREMLASTVRVTVPYAGVEALAYGSGKIRRAEIPDPIGTLALAAGMPAEEVIARHGADDLDEAAVRTLLALQNVVTA